ncbi:LacI family DNA-binding transcriptional regulator [uncultured Catenibacterium sp.]|mgnify:FL=1|uniref:LacI family DNA-binding transcriptional regulator n=1 Tax=uncultured Catenibacterium sp. TaxID=286142 RepID=UPI0025E6B92C|nr:LacI family DNA-binding transcriptional regulator [uncultured Catenibacterium sp.]
MKVTMKDIAKELNISINAVSIALNDKPGVSESMRLKILRTADKMGYINEKHHYLSVFSKSNICILMQSYYANTGHFYSIVLRSIVECAKQLGYISILNYFEDNQFEFPDCIIDRKVAGILVVGKISDQNLNQLKNTGIPVVLVDYTSLRDTCDCVLTHNKQGGYLITQYVLDKGYKRVGFFGDLEYSLSFSDRFIGYKQALVNRSITSDIESYINQYSILHGTEKYVLENDVNGIVSLLKKSELPEVFVCANDSNAFILLNALTLMNIKVPDQIGITGFDDTPLCNKTIPKLTTVQVQKELMGEIAVSKLIDRIHRENDVQMTQLLSTKIIERDSLK